MTHLDELLSVYLDGEATPEESARLGLHLGECLRCRRRLTDLNDVRAAVRSLPILELPPRLVPAATDASVKRRHPGRWGAAAAAAAAIIAVATLTAPDPEPLDLSDLSRQVGARAALDLGTGSLKVLVPTAVSE